MEDFSCHVLTEIGSLCELMSSSAIIQGDSLGPTEHKLTIDELLKEGPIAEVASVWQSFSLSLMDRKSIPVVDAHTLARSYM